MSSSFLTRTAWKGRLASLVFLAQGWWSLAGLSIAGACPFCGEPTITLSEQVSRSDFVALAQWVETNAVQEGGAVVGAPRTKYEIVQVARDGSKLLKIGQTVQIERMIPGKRGNLAMLLGKRPLVGGSELPEWKDPIEVTEIAYQYVMQAPGREASAEQRLNYFSRFLEYPDLTIANDAYAEFANASYTEIVPVARKMSPAKLRTWVFDDAARQRLGRRALYGMMLGLCGTDEDAQRLEAIITVNSKDEIRQGIDGMTGGYLLLRGTAGLEKIEAVKLSDPEISFDEVMPVMNALRFMWTYGNERIPKERLRESLRPLILRPITSELAITDLARWKDWAIQQDLFELYGGTGEFSEPRLKKKIIRFLLASIRDVPRDKSGKPLPGNPPEHARRGREYLERLRAKDPKLVAEMERLADR